jgi:hypothetical protein
METRSTMASVFVVMRHSYDGPLKICSTREKAEEWIAVDRAGWGSAPRSLYWIHEWVIDGDEVDE